MYIDMFMNIYCMQLTERQGPVKINSGRDYAQTNGIEITAKVLLLTFVDILKGRHLRMNTKSISMS